MPRLPEGCPIFFCLVCCLGTKKGGSTTDPWGWISPCNLYLLYWKHGKPAALDVTVIFPVQRLTLQGAAVTQGHALDVEEERKLASPLSACHFIGISFVPLVVRSFGGWSCEAVETIRVIGHLQGQQLGLPISETISHSFQQLGIHLWRGNACMWTTHVPISSPILLI